MEERGELPWLAIIFALVTAIYLVWTGTAITMAMITGNLRQIALALLVVVALIVFDRHVY